MKRRDSIGGQEILTFVLATLPATLLCIVAAFGVYVGVVATFAGESVGLLMVAWGGVGLYATVCLWLVTFGYRARWIALGLTLGVAAVAPISLSIVWDAGWSPTFDELGMAIWAVALPVLAVKWIVRILVNPAPAPSDLGVEERQ